MRVLISGGGTGGHIYPAIAIADALKSKNAEIEILFVGANGRMEMTKVPAAGYDIKGLDIAGFQRRLTLKNLSFPFKVMKSLKAASRIIRHFKPDVGVGVGGYASGPAMYSLSGKGIPLLLQEQNSYPGITNKILASKAQTICTAYPEMSQFFPQEKIEFTGNPVRTDLLEVASKRDEAYSHFGLDPKKKTCLIVGGSLGALTLNKAMDAGCSQLESVDNLQFVWQIGAAHEERFMASDTAKLSHVKATKFIDRMDLAYAAGDLMIGRAGALTISELSIVGMPTILVPSPNVSEDHQTKNAMALVNRDAALLVKDADAQDTLITEAIRLSKDRALQQTLASNVRQLAKPTAADRIAELVLALGNNKT